MSNQDGDEGWTSVAKPKKPKTQRNETSNIKGTGSKPLRRNPQPISDRKPQTNDASHGKSKLVIPKDIVSAVKMTSVSHLHPTAPSAKKEKVKKRPAENMALMDLITAQLKVNSSSHGHVSHKRHTTAPADNFAKKASHYPAAAAVVKMVRSKDPTLQEFRAVTKKKKKKLSTVKKRVLMERLNRHVRLMIESGVITSVNSAVNSKGSCVMALINFTTDDIADDPDEMEEMLSDASELLTPFGSILHMQHVTGRAVQPEGSGMLLPPAESHGELQVTFATPTEAYAAACALDGLVMGGDTIRSRLVGGPELESNVYDARYGSGEGPGMTLSDRTAPFVGLSDVITGKDSSVVGAGSFHCVKLWNVVTGDEVYDPDEAEEVLADISFLCEAYGQSVSASIVPMPENMRDRLIRCCPTGSSYIRTKSPGGGPGDQHTRSSSPGDVTAGPVSFPVAFVRCSDLATALDAANKVQGAVISGQRVSLSLYDCFAFDKAVFHQEHHIPLPRKDSTVPVDASVMYGLRVWILTGDDGGNIALHGGSGEAVQLYVQNRVAAASAHTPGIDSVGKLVDQVVAADVYIPRVLAEQEPIGVQSAYDIVLGPFSLDDCIILEDILTLQHSAEDCPQGPFDAIRVDICAIRETPKSVWSDSSVVHVQTISRSRCRGGVEVETGESTVLQGGCVVAVSGFLSEDDVLDAISFPEEVAALKRDLMEVMGLHRPVNGDRTRTSCGKSTVWSYCKSCTFVTEERAAATTISDHAFMWASQPYVRLEFSDAEEARNVMFAFDGSVMGGEVVVATLTENEELALRQRRGMELGAAGAEVVSGEAKASGAKVAAADAPKLPKHSVPAHTYIPRLEENGITVVKEMLQTLAMLQQRAKEKDPVNYKKRERFVMGIKQATNTVKSRRCRLLLLAPDTEESDIIDTKIVDMIQVAQENGIPAVYSLKRRQLGKAAGVTMKQSVVSVCNVDGAERQFKILLDMIGFNS